MCCLFTTIMFLGPRFGVMIWWLINPLRFNLIFDTYIFPLLGILFLPWTTLMYIGIAPGGILGFDWIWLGLALLVDLSSYGGGAYGNRKKISG